MTPWGCKGERSVVCSVFVRAMAVIGFIDMVRKKEAVRTS